MPHNLQAILIWLSRKNPLSSTLAPHWVRKLYFQSWSNLGLSFQLNITFTGLTLNLAPTLTLSFWGSESEKLQLFKKIKLHNIRISFPMPSTDQTPTSRREWKMFLPPASSLELSNHSMWVIQWLRHNYLLTFGSNCSNRFKLLWTIKRSRLL